MIYIHKDINFWKTKVKLPDSYLISTDIDAVSYTHLTLPTIA